jgi:PIN domain nuclease of toxin-antitoxin system
MPAPINEQTRKQVIHQWVSGDNRDKIAIDNGIGEGTVSGIVSDWKTGLEDSEYESVRELAVQSKKQGLALSDLSSRFRLYNIIKKSAANEDQIESFISNCISGAVDSSLPQEKIVDLTNQLFNISKSESIPLEQVPEDIQQKLQQKHKIEEQIKEAESELQSKNVTIETIDEHIHLNEELSKHGLSTKDTVKLLNVIKNMDQQGFDTKKIVAKAMSIKSLKDREKDLRNNCEILAKRIDRYKQILPFAEKIVAMRINTAGLLALDDAVNNVAEMYNLPVYTAGLLGNQ